MSEKVYKWYADFGRMGHLEGLFVATEAAVKAAIGQRAYFGEVLGKHSEIYGELEEAEFTVLSEDPAVVAFAQEHGPFGRNPLDYVTIECEECGGHMQVQEEQDYWCETHELRICYSCKKEHKGPSEAGDEDDVCEVVEYEGQTPSYDAEESDDESE
jgi:hypothetical protein